MKCIILSKPNIKLLGIDELGILEPNKISAEKRKK